MEFYFHFDKGMNVRKPVTVSPIPTKYRANIKRENKQITRVKTIVIFYFFGALPATALSMTETIVWRRAI